MHVHTPDTLKEDQFEGSTSDEKWEKFCTTINESKEDISVIGITDYLLLDNYKKFLSLVSEGKITKKFDLIIPNLELRLVPVTADGKALNLHILVDPDFVSQIEERIYSKLSIKNGTTTYSATRDGLIRLGKSVNSALSDDDAYKEGARKFVIDFDTLKQCLITMCHSWITASLLFLIAQTMVRVASLNIQLSLLEILLILM